MIFKRRRTKEQDKRSDRDEAAYEEAARHRLRSIGETGGYSYSSDEREDVEARIRRMRYGAKQEGSRAESDGEP